MLPLRVSGPGSDGNKGVLSIPQSSSIAGISPSDCLVSYQDTRWEGGSYPSAEKQSVYSTAPADWTCKQMNSELFENKVTNELSYTYIIQSVEALEYTDCTNTERLEPPTKSVLDMTLNRLMGRFQSWSFGECEPPIHCHYSQVHSDTEW